MRKRNLIVMTLVGAMALAITGCSNHTKTDTKPDTTAVVSEKADEPSETEENNDITTESLKPPRETEPSVSETETTTEKEETQDQTQEATTEVSQETQKPTAQEKPEPTESQTQTEQPTTQEAVETQTPTQESTTQEPTTEERSTEEQTTEESSSEAPATQRATAEDCEAIADKVIEYINSYRDTPATKLPGLTVYAQYRSRQLVSNFAHDTFDERAAATALQYGTYVDPVVYGGEGEPYYAAGAREAIAAGGYVGDIDYVAQQIALLVKGSQGHWCYVGSSDYPYIAVGITYESGMWYCDIAMARENTDE